MVALSNATAAGSPFGFPVITVSPIRVAQVCNCSTAAARKVSAAPSKTRLPELEIFAANLATEVVLPVTLTPITKIVVKPVSELANVRGLELSRAVSASRIASTGSSDLLFLAVARIASVKDAPKSEAISSA